MMTKVHAMDTCYTFALQHMQDVVQTACKYADTMHLHPALMHTSQLLVVLGPSSHLYSKHMHDVLTRHAAADGARICSFECIHLGHCMLETFRWRQIHYMSKGWSEKKVTTTACWQSAHMVIWESSTWTWHAVNQHIVVSAEDTRPPTRQILCLPL